MKPSEEQKKLNAEQVYFKKLSISLSELRDEISTIKNDFHQEIIGPNSGEINCENVLAETMKRNLQVCWDLLHETQYCASFIANDKLFAFSEQIEKDLRK